MTIRRPTWGTDAPFRAFSRPRLVFGGRRRDRASSLHLSVVRTEQRLFRLLALVIMLVSQACSSSPGSSEEPTSTTPTIDPTTASADVGPEGGTIRHASGAELIVPPGALSAPAHLTLSGELSPRSDALHATVIGGAIEAGPEGQTFLKPVELVLPIDPALVPAGGDATHAQIFTAPHGSSDFSAIDSHVDLASRTIRARTIHFSQFIPAINPNPLFILEPEAYALPAATTGVPYSTTFVASGGTGPYTWSLSSGSLSAGLSITNDTLSGTPTTAGGNVFFINAADMIGNAVQKAFLLNVMAANPVPVLTSITPSSAFAGSLTVTVTLRGSDFIPACEARWDGAPLPTTFVSDTELTATIDAAYLTTPGSHVVLVAAPPPGGGSSAGSAFEVMAGNPVPTIDSIFPTNLPLSTVDTQITVQGSNFSALTSATIDNQGISTFFVSSTQLYATIPASYLATASLLHINVYNPPPGGGFGPATVPLQVGAPVAPNPVPVLSSITPASTYVNKNGVTLTITGVDLAANGQVLFDGTALVTTVTSTTSATAVVPASLLTATGSFLVTFTNPTPGGGTSGARAFLVTPPPLSCADAQAAAKSPANNICDPYDQVQCGVTSPYCQDIAGAKVQVSYVCTCAATNGFPTWSCLTGHQPCPF